MPDDKITIKRTEKWAYIEHVWQNQKQEHPTKATQDQPQVATAAPPAAPEGASVQPQATDIPTPSCTETFLSLDRSLTDMLMDSGDTSNVSNSDDLTTIIHLEASLTAANIRISGLIAENTSLNNQISLLNDEIERQKKTLESQKSNLKKLTVTNDNLRKEISQYRGMRKHTQGAVDTTAISLHDNQNTIQIKEDLVIAQAKLSSLRDEMMGITSSMLSLLDEEPGSDTGFQLVSRRKDKRKSPNRTMDLNPNTCKKPQTPITAPRHQQPNNDAQPISVITGVGKSDTVHTGSHEQAPGSRPQPTSYRARNMETQRQSQQPADETYVIGTSLTRGLGTRLRRHGIDGTVFTYPGATIPHIRSRLKHILSPHKQPREIVLQCGGNDLESQPADKVSHQYDCLIEDVRKLCPNSIIITSNVPPRGRKTSTLKKIDLLNVHLANKSDCENNITNIDVCPTMPVYFSNDQVHFNNRGANMYARNLAQSLINFSLYQMREMM